jgi:hypothetical protein
LNQINKDNLESATRVSIKVQKGNDFSVNFRDIVKKSAENIYQSVNGEVNENVKEKRITIPC